MILLLFYVETKTFCSFFFVLLFVLSLFLVSLFFLLSIFISPFKKNIFLFFELSG